MGFVKMTCPNCGANFDMNGDLDFGVCNFCGTKIAVDKTIVEHRGTVSVKGVADTDALLDRVQLFIEDGNFEEAKHYCERVLDLNPRNHVAYIMKLLAQTQCKSRSQLGSLTKPLQTYDSYQKTMRFAPKEVKQQLMEYNTQTVNRFEMEKAKKLSDISALEQKILDRKQKKDSAKFWTKMFKTFRIIDIIVGVLITLMIAAVAERKGWALVGILLLAGGLVFLTVMRNNGNKFLTEQNRMLDERGQMKAQYKEWLNNMQQVIS